MIRRRIWIPSCSTCRWLLCNWEVVRHTDPQALHSRSPRTECSCWHSPVDSSGPGIWAHTPCFHPSCNQHYMLGRSPWHHCRYSWYPRTARWLRRATGTCTRHSVPFWAHTCCRWVMWFCIYFRPPRSLGCIRDRQMLIDFYNCLLTEYRFGWLKCY